MDSQKSGPGTVKGRLIKFLSDKGISHRSFERECGLGNGYVNNIRTSIQPDKLALIMEKYPELSVEWLMSGRGEMQKGGNIQTIHGDGNHHNNNGGDGRYTASLEQEVAALRKEIAALQEERRQFLKIIENLTGR